MALQGRNAVARPICVAGGHGEHASAVRVF